MLDTSDMTFARSPEAGQQHLELCQRQVRKRPNIKISLKAYHLSICVVFYVDMTPSLDFTGMSHKSYMICRRPEPT